MINARTLDELVVTLAPEYMSDIANLRFLSILPEYVLLIHFFA
jgi:hypothetical protein